jgi:hypothetical protein
VQDQGVVAQASVQQGLLDRLEPVEVQVLRALELVGAVGVADGYRQGINSGLFDELDGFVRVGIDPAFGEMAAFLAGIELGADQLA